MGTQPIRLRWGRGMYRKAPHRPRTFERDGRFRIPRDDGRSQFLEAMSMLAVLAVLTAVLGFAVGVPFAVMLNDLCTSIRC